MPLQQTDNPIANSDQVVLLKPRKNVFIPVDAMGIPKTNDDKVLLLMQNKAAHRAGRDPRKDYCMVYLPPFYRMRFWLFGLSLWTAICWAVVFTILIPVLVGRAATRHFIGRDVHDGINLVRISSSISPHLGLIALALLDLRLLYMFGSLASRQASRQKSRRLCSKIPRHASIPQSI